MFGIGGTELIVILIVALIFIGPKRLPEVAGTIGKWYRELNEVLSGLKAEMKVAEESSKQDEEKREQGGKNKA